MQWTPEIEISAADAERLVEEQFPSLAPVTLEAFGHGWDNSAFLAGDAYVFRFPRRAIAVALIEREIAVLPRFAAALPVPISNPVFAGAPGDGYPWPFAGYRKLEGRTACEFDPTGIDFELLTRDLATFLRALHAVDAAPLLENGLTEDTIGRLDFEKTLKLSKERLEELVSAGLVEKPEVFVEILRTIAPVPGEGPRALVHGDLYARHILLQENRLSGVIDWGDVHFGTPALDLGIVHAMIPPRFHAGFRERYGPVDSRTWEIARYRGLYMCILIAHYGRRTGDGDLVRAGLRGMGLIREAGRA